MGRNHKLTQYLEGKVGGTSSFAVVPPLPLLIPYLYIRASSSFFLFVAM